MSTDYDLVCRPCKRSRHLGQRMADTWSFGYGSNDTEGRADAWAFIGDHVAHGDLAIIYADPPLDGVEDDG